MFEPHPFQLFCEPKEMTNHFSVKLKITSSAFASSLACLTRVYFSRYLQMSLLKITSVFAQRMSQVTSSCIRGDSRDSPGKKQLIVQWRIQSFI